MLGSLLRPRRNRGRVDRSPFSSPFNTVNRNPQNNSSHHNDPSSDEEDGQNHDQNRDRDQERQPLAYRHPDSEYSIENEDEDEDREPLLPIFSSAHLDELPLYSITHTVRILVMQRCETTLSWDQLRSPQISQFLVKPIQSAIRADHFNRSSISALLANCLQFGKEAEESLGNYGISRTRAILCELLAMRLLKDFSSRELIDALSYDFDPLQGMSDSRELSPRDDGADTAGPPRQSVGARISAVEIAIRANAKRFLAHPLVVQQLQAIWAGNIVFHSAADNLHRVSQPAHRPALGTSYGAIGPGQTTPKQQVRAPNHVSTVRRAVTIYDPRDASLFKLSRLRVPRYRQIFSTLSFSIMLGLYLAVLVDRSLSITPLEVLFWFWSTGYMLDELVGFNEQGFGLYIMSVWNAFDLGILMLFFAYYILRLWGILMPDVRKHFVANMAYDVLAATAVLLFPRAFSVLDNYRYFSQLLIAFRLMAQDLAAVFGLIGVCCSGFFVAFSMSFMSDDKSSSDVAYTLFQIVMGFTPAVWDNWTSLNLLGKIIMGVFLSLCHFLIVTILITVLTNSFMAIVQNSNEEHQFLLAVNTISMVKSDALFSYIAPSNILAWLISPLRYILPFRSYVKFNRYMIKFSHFPILLAIFLYERLVLSSFASDRASDYLEVSRREQKSGFLSMHKPSRITRLREPSIISFHKDRALDEVFRQPFPDTSPHAPGSRAAVSDRGRSAHVVDSWIQRVGNASPPMEQPQSVLDRLETRRPLLRRTTTTDNARRLKRDFSTATRSVISEPEDRLTMAGRRRRPFDMGRSPAFKRRHEETDADDELLTNDENDTFTLRSAGHQEPGPGSAASKDAVPGADSNTSASMPKAIPDRSLSHAARARLLDAPPSARKQAKKHDRQVSTDTIVFQPPQTQPDRPQTSRGLASPGDRTPLTDTRSAPKPMLRSRPNLAARGQSQLGIDFMSQLQQRSKGRVYREPSFNAIALDLASDLGDNRAGPDGRAANISASFSEQVFNEMERGRDLKRRREEEERQRQDQEEKAMVGRIMLARMNTLEEGFREMLKEVKDMKNDSRAPTEVGPSTPMTASGPSWLLRPGAPLERANSTDTRPVKQTRKKLFSRRSKGKESDKSPHPAESVYVPTGSPQPSGTTVVEPADPELLEKSPSTKRQSLASTDKRAESESKRSSVIFRGKSSEPSTETQAQTQTQTQTQGQDES